MLDHLTGQIRVLAIGGSTRPRSMSEMALRLAANAARDAGAAVQIIASRSLIMPVYDTEREFRTPQACALIDALREVDALIISSPGYHGSLSGMMKNALDYLEDLRCDRRIYLDGMAVGCIAVAHGWQATVSTLQTMRTVIHALRGWPSPLGVAINASQTSFDESGACMDEGAQAQLRTVGTQVVEFARARKIAEVVTEEKSSRHVRW